MSSKYEFLKVLRGEIKDPGVADENGNFEPTDGPPMTYLEAAIAYPEEEAEAVSQFKAEIFNRLATALGICGDVTMPVLLNESERYIRERNEFRKQLIDNGIL